MTNTPSSVTRRIYLLFCLLAFTLLSLAGGCHGKPKSTTKVPSDEALERQLDEALRWTYENRHLNTKEHAAWQILHGVLTYKRDFKIRHEGKLISAVDYLLEGGLLDGWDAGPGIELDKKTGKRGLQVRTDPGSETGQGHYDQWLAVLAQCDLESNQEIRVRDKSFTMEDYVKQVMWDMPRNLDQEYSWTLIGLTTYLPSDTKWTASDGREWSISRLVQSEADREIGDGACGGTHRLIGLTMALDSHVQSGGKLSGPWQTADQKIQAAIGQAKKYQNADGSFSNNYLDRGGVSPDFGEVLGTSGHVLEFLALAMTKEQLQQPWVKRAVSHICQLLEQTKSVELKCGALYHATHGLALYRQKVFDKSIETTTQPQAKTKDTTPTGS